MKFLRCAFIIFLTALTGCSSLKEESGGELRLISAAPSTTEILFAIGLGDNIVGVSQNCNFPPEALAKTKIGTFSNPQIEKLIGLRPDLVFLTGLEQAETRIELEKLGIHTVTVYPKDLDGLYASIRSIGEMTDRREKADALIERMKEGIGLIEEKVRGVPQDKRPKVLFEIMDDPLIVAGSKSFAGQLAEIAGGVNIAFDTVRDYSKFSPELVIDRDPDCIILGYMFKAEGVTERVSKRLGWSNINAVKNDSIFNDIHPDILLRPGPRAEEAVREIYKRLYEG